MSIITDSGFFYSFQSTQLNKNKMQNKLITNHLC